MAASVNNNARKMCSSFLWYHAFLFGLILISSCLAQNQNGLGDDFQPIIKPSCVGNRMNIRVDTTLPFEGVVHTPKRYVDGCAVNGTGGLKTILTIDLSNPDKCGVEFDKANDERKVPIAVRAHKTIELLEDKLYLVSCGKVGYRNSRNEITVVGLKVTPLRNRNRKLTTVIEGSQYNLGVEAVDHDPNFGFLVKNCIAFDDSDKSITLVDDRGCGTDNLISDFKYDHSKGTADATIYSMFRVSPSNRTSFQCDVGICVGQCQIPECSTVAVAGGPLSSFTETKSDTRIGSEEDSVMTSTSVFVAQPGSEAAATVFDCEETGLVADDWLLWLCVAFGILFAIMLVINIFLCTAMTCSCTKSEIIEKEPSIYDDYSIYDSQYGYANENKAYGSGSDYGSDYGLPPPDPEEEMGSGTYSRYRDTAGHGSTLSRSRH